MTVKILYTHTDSLMYEINNQNPYAIMRSNIDAFDTSDYPAKKQFDMPLKNKKVVGLIKKECNGKIITKCVGLWSKMYSVRVENEDCIKKGKDVKTFVVQQTIEFKDYIACFYDVLLRNIASNAYFDRILIKFERSNKPILL